MSWAARNLEQLLDPLSLWQQTRAPSRTRQSRKQQQAASERKQRSRRLPGCRPQQAIFKPCVSRCCHHETSVKPWILGDHLMRIASQDAACAASEAHEAHNNLDHQKHTKAHEARRPIVLTKMPQPDSASPPDEGDCRSE